ncbi:H/ACA ribonucleoprotein complex subunit GAR1 [Methanosphaera sp. BMS]|uniref:H/ACA ribonucleoprotein complex subunit GAR1 n=1 Tax=Methanosphaera sp. BMS TaxID=1789762 RepID=UPI000DC1CE9D|nr:Gar1/Naf1 family protein [Methanosphaera sp. BMS]AWX33165.1 hypothetical protein AW729_08730 [Methanosphaera sp. BMS]
MTRKNSKLKKIGNISHVTSTNKIIVPSNKSPRIGLLVVNKNNKAIGKINDIIGSTKNPYVSIKTNKKFHKINVGEAVYLPPKNKKRRMRPRQAY